MGIRRAVGAAVLFLLSCAAPAAEPARPAAPAPPDARIETAIAAIRHVAVPASREQNRAKEEELAVAWQTLEDRKGEALSRLKAEVRGK